MNRMNKLLIDGPFIGKVLNEPYTRTVTLEAREPRAVGQVAVIDETVYRLFLIDGTRHIGFYSCDKPYIQEKIRSIECPK